MITQACIMAYCLVRARPAGIEPATIGLEDVPTPPTVASTCGYGCGRGVCSCLRRRGWTTVRTTFDSMRSAPEGLEGSVVGGCPGDVTDRDEVVGNGVEHPVPA